VTFAGAQIVGREVQSSTLTFGPTGFASLALSRVRSWLQPSRSSTSRARQLRDCTVIFPNINAELELCQEPSVRTSGCCYFTAPSCDTVLGSGLHVRIGVAGPARN